MSSTPDVHEVHVLRQERRALEIENQHLKEMLSQMADELYGWRSHVNTELERLVLTWIERSDQILSMLGVSNPSARR